MWRSIDLTSRAVSGTWSFEDGFKLPYVLGQSDRPTATRIQVCVCHHLSVKNEGGCLSTFSQVYLCRKR